MEVEKAYAIGVLKCSKDIIFIAKRNALAHSIVNDDRKGWPATQIFPDRSPVCATKLDVEAEW